MIKSVLFDKTTYADLPFKFEAGTPNIAAAISLEAAINYIENIGIDDIEAHEKDILNYCIKQMDKLDGLTIYGSKNGKRGVVSFNIDNIDSFDAGMILDKMGVAVRTGAHCTEPIMKHYGIAGTVRVSFALYNTKDEVDQLISGLQKTKEMLL